MNSNNTNFNTWVNESYVLLSFFQNIDLILKSLNSVGTTIIQSMAQTGTTSTPQGVPDEMRSSIENLGTVDLIGLFALLLVPLFVTWLASIIVQIVIFLRFAEIYILSSAATLPLVFVGHPETKSIALGYLRKYGAAVLHGVMLIVAIKIYETFQKSSLNMQGIIGNGGMSFKTLGDFVTNTGQLLIVPLFFIFLILATGRFAKVLMGERNQSILIAHEKTICIWPIKNLLLVS